MTTLVEDLKALLDTLGAAGGVSYALNQTEPAVFPYIVFQRIVSTSNVSLSGPSDLQNTRVQIDLYSRTQSGLVALETALEAALAASPIVNIPISSQDLPEPALRIYRASKDYSMWSKN